MVARPARPTEPAAFPPLSGRTDNLPVQPTPLIGRDHDIAALRARLLNPAVRLLTLTGPPGTGKTRLAIAAAGKLANEFADGVWFVGLESIREPEQVLAAIMQALGVRDAAGQPLTAAIAAELTDRQLLLVLDNFEHVLPAGIRVADLLAACPRLNVLATSRTPLKLRWEHEFPVAPLALPDSSHLADATAVGCSPAEELFRQRAVAARPDFGFSREHAADVARICATLDGLPLAIELAAARVKLLPPSAILERLGHRLALLTGGPRDTPARQQSLRAALAWSYDLLTADEQALFGRLGVFAGGCTLDAVEAVAARGWEAEPAPQAALVAALSIEEGMAALLDGSLVRKETDRSGEPRYRMLETLREYALEQLAAAGELEDIRRRHAEHFMRLAEEAQPQLLAGGQQTFWLGRLEAEHDNLQAALDWATTAVGGAEIAVRLGGSLFRFWSLRGYLSEGRHWLDRVVAVGADAPAPARKRALNAAGLVARLQGDFERAAVLHEQCLGLARQENDLRSIAVSYHNLALVAQHGRSDYPAARALYEESLALWKELGDAWGISGGLNNLGGLAILMGDYAEAEAALEESLALCRTIDDTEGVAHALGYLGVAALRQGDQDRAAALLAESLAQYATLGDRHGMTQCLEELAEVAAARRRPERAARLLGAAEALRAALGIPREPADREAVERTVAATRADLGEVEFALAWEAGGALSLEQAIAEARRLDEPGDAGGLTAPERFPAAPAQTSSLPDKLTAREAEVLRLIAAGRTNREIAADLVLSGATVERHISNLYAKIGARGRAEATAYAFRHALAAPSDA